MEVINQTEANTLAKLEKVVERGKKAFIEVGNALKEIRDGKLYRASHKTFAVYVEDRFGFKRANAYHYIEAAQVAGELSDKSDKIKTATQAAEVAKAPAEKQSKVVDRAAEIADERGQDITAKVMAEARKEVMGELVDNDPPPILPTTAEHTQAIDTADEYEDWDPDDDEPNRIGELLETIQRDFQPLRMAGHWRTLDFYLSS